ncbi:MULTISPECIES: hypothetical protein [unclassified Bradyrhizobium]|uniref:hypothetical protein n=1 Tax=unclassified Bradyrhizobium TaxID=2631580 RepID=UPI0028E52940|nr:MULTISPECIES: hypothetical protein [unclassified Bradyrhizobium]
MLTIDRNEAARQDGESRESVALVPLVHGPEYRSPPPRSVRPDASFVAHLIATAEQVPQTRHLRRAATADALSAYATHQHPTVSAAGRTRQVI